MQAIVEVLPHVRGAVEVDSLPLPGDLSRSYMHAAIGYCVDQGARGVTLAVPAHRLREYAWRYGVEYAGVPITYHPSDARNPSPAATVVRALRAQARQGHRSFLVLAGNWLRSSPPFCHGFAQTPGRCPQNSAVILTDADINTLHRGAVEAAAYSDDANIAEVIAKKCAGWAVLPITANRI